MTQGVLPFKYEEEKNNTGMTALAGLPIYLDLTKMIGLSKSIQNHLKIRRNGQGCTLFIPAPNEHLIGKDEAFIHIEINDKGYGIGKEHLSKIFNRFYRVDKVKSRYEGGIGL